MLAETQLSVGPTAEIWPPSYLLPALQHFVLTVYYMNDISCEEKKENEEKSISRINTSLIRP